VETQGARFANGERHLGKGEDMKLTGQVAIVTGAGQNIGEAIAKLFAEEGAAVAVVDLNPTKGGRVASEIKASGGKAIAITCDVSKSADVQAMVEQVVKEFGKIDILVNNAARTCGKNIFDTTEEEWDGVLAVSLKSQFLCCKYVAQQMVKQGGGGKIVNLSSTSGHMGRAGAISYCTAKAGVLNFTRALASELAPYKIRVNSLTPTKTGSPVGKDVEPPDRPHKEILVGRVGRPIDQAKAALFLVSDDSDFVDGADLRVDGGALAHWND
jgi:NAD(P)-dependent dehydrogenase (short-subunit alcohol dehydrogenase family)